MHIILFLFAFSTFFGAQIRIGNEVLTVEIAETRETRSRGLMGRTELPEGTGMLFVYKVPERQTFWMKNTLIPLSLGFFDADKNLIQIVHMNPPEPKKELITYTSDAPVLYALEVPQGWFKRHGIGLGAKFSFLDRQDQVE